MSLSLSDLVPHLLLPEVAPGDGKGTLCELWLPGSGEYEWKGVHTGIVCVCQRRLRRPALVRATPAAVTSSPPAHTNVQESIPSPRDDLRTQAPPVCGSASLSDHRVILESLEE